MKKQIIIVVALLTSLSSPLFAQTIITQWNFNGPSSTTVPGGPSAPTPSTGVGTVQLIGLVTASFSTGVGSSDLLSSPPNFGWQTTGYPASGNEKTAGIIISASTAGFNSISLVFDQRLSSTSANTWFVYYTTDITAGSPTWVQAQIFTFTPSLTSGDAWYNQRTVDFSAVPSLNDNPNAAFKIVSAYDPGVGNYVASSSNKTYAGGTSRFDMVTVSGIADIIIQNTPPTVSVNSVTGNFNVGDTLHASYIYTDAEGDQEGASIYKWYRADDANGTNEIEIAGADTTVYVPESNDLNKFIAFEVTPVAQTGVSPGTAVKTSYQGPVQQSLEVLLYPSPYDLSSGNYSLQAWPSGSTPGTYPANMDFQVFNAEPASKSTKPNALWECVYNGSSKSRMLGLADRGIGFLNTGSVQDAGSCGNGSNVGAYVGATVLAINTTGLSNLTLSWVASLEVQGDGSPAREYRLNPQYKIAGSSIWTDFGAQYEFSSVSAVVGQDVVNSLTLPAAIENLPDVLIRWIYYQAGTGASGSRPEIRLDEIMVSTPGAPNSAPVATGLTLTGLPLIAQTQAASYLYSDAEGDLEGQSVVTWYRADDASGTNAVQIAGANGLSYILSASDVGKYVAFEVGPVALTGTLVGVPVKSSYEGPVLNEADPSIIKINEIYSRGADTNTDQDLKSDWVEFYNPGAIDATLAGLQLCDSDHCQILPFSAYASYTVPAHGFLTLTQNDVNSFTFGLSSAGEYVALKRSDNSVLIDSINFPALDVTQSYGRYFDGTSRIVKLVPPSKGISNNNATPVDDVTGLIMNNESETRVFPVPVKSELTVEAPDGKTIQNISVLTATGQEVEKMVPSGTSVQISFLGMSSGFYILRITYQDGFREMRKIVRD